MLAVPASPPCAEPPQGAGGGAGPSSGSRYEQGMGVQLGSPSLYPLDSTGQRDFPVGLGQLGLS